MLICMLSSTTVLRAQQPGSSEWPTIAPVERRTFPLVIHQPVVSDSTLLFFAPDLVWKCAYSSGELEVEWDDADFARVKRCEGAIETYGRVRSAQGGYEYKLQKREVRALLQRTSDTTFTYSALRKANSAKVSREVPLALDLAKPVWTDSSYTEQCSGEIELEVRIKVRLSETRP